MKIIHTKRDELVTAKWSGGTSTQLAIYPPQASFQNIDFLFRLSTATVETEKSIFSRLPGVKRKIMVLEGQLSLKHIGHHSKTLKKFEVDEFMGDWETKAFGRVTDFNLMTKGNTSGTIEYLHLNSGNKQTFEFSMYGSVLGIYLLKGSFLLNNHPVEQGDMVIIYKDENKDQFTIHIQQNAEMVVVRIIL